MGEVGGEDNLLAMQRRKICASCFENVSCMYLHSLCILIKFRPVLLLARAVRFARLLQRERHATAVDYCRVHQAGWPQVPEVSLTGRRRVLPASFSFIDGARVAPEKRVHRGAVYRRTQIYSLHEVPTIYAIIIVIISFSLHNIVP